MKKIFLFMLAAFMLTSCDSFKGSNSKDDDTEEEEPKKKKKKNVDEEDEDDEEDNDDEPQTKKKKKPSDEEEDLDNEDKGWTKQDEKTVLDQCVSVAEKKNPAKAEAYCECMLNKVKKLYSNMNEFDRKLTTEKANELAVDCQ